MENLVKEYKKHLCGFNDQFESDVKEALYEELCEVIGMAHEFVNNALPEGLYLDDHISVEDLIDDCITMRAHERIRLNQESVWFKAYDG